MSLINDAIKQANKANKERADANPPPAAPPIAGMTSADASARGAHPPGGSMTSMLLIAGIVVFVLLGGSLLFLAMRNTPAVDPGSTTNAASAPATPIASETAVATTTETNPIAAALQNPLPPTSTGRPAPVAPSVATPAPDVATSTPAVPVPDPQPVGPRPFPELKLQGIYYRLNDPSVMINGRTLENGDFVEDVKLIEIGRKEVTVELDGQQKVLRLQKAPGFKGKEG
jgi:hypothetical protein